MVPWLPSSWQFFHVNMILVSRWDRRAFAPDAQHFQQGDAHGWTKVGAPLSSDQVPTRIDKGGWDQRSAGSASRASVGRMARRLFESKRRLAVPTCYKRYGRTRDLGFILAT